MTSIFFNPFPYSRDNARDFYFLTERHYKMTQLLGLGEWEFSRMKFCWKNRKWFLQAGYQHLGDFYEIQLEDHQAFAINYAWAYEISYCLSYREKQIGREILGDDSSSPNWDNIVELQFVKERHHDVLKWILYQGSQYWILSPEEIESIFL